MDPIIQQQQRGVVGRCWGSCSSSGKSRYLSRYGMSLSAVIDSDAEEEVAGMSIFVFLNKYRLKLRIENIVE